MNILWCFRKWLELMNVKTKQKKKPKAKNNQVIDKNYLKVFNILQINMSLDSDISFVVVGIVI